MLALVAAVIGLGYTLVYAAVANGGRFAEQPWRAFVEDAYSGDSPTPSASFFGSAFKFGKSILSRILNPFGLSLPIPFLP
jgi:hypothetical protein